MSWSTDGRDLFATANTDLIVAVSVHSGDPGSAGTDDEWTGGGYSRQSPVWDAADGGTVGLDEPLEFAGPPLTDAAYVGLWAAGGVFVGAVARGSGDAASNAAGEYTLASLTLTVPATITA